MSIQGLRAHWGFTRSPFTKDLAPSMLHRHAGHAEAVARIAWCVDEAAIGVVTGEVGAGKTVSIRAALWNPASRAMRMSSSQPSSMPRSSAEIDGFLTQCWSRWMLSSCRFSTSVWILARSPLRSDGAGRVAATDRHHRSPDNS